MTQNRSSTSVCAAAGCDQLARVGVGENPVRWVCFRHYEDYLANVKRVLDLAAEELLR